MKVSFQKILLNASITLLLIVIGIVLLEVSARILWHKKYNQWLEKQLHGYEYLDYGRSIIMPIPNTKITVSQHKKKLIEHGKKIGLTNLEKIIRRHSLVDSDILFRINSYGFKGPEFSLPKPDSTFRILAIGDSCTWGPEVDSYSYPRIMERKLNHLTEDLVKFEVINAGVMGYNFERVLKRIDDFLAVEPDLVTIYLGWNRTIGRADPRKSLYLYRNFSLYKIYYHFVINREDTGLQEDYRKNTYYDEIASQVEEYNSCSFEYDINDLNTLVKQIEGSGKNIRIVIITLAGLFDWRKRPDERALKSAYPIASSNNLYLYSLLTKKYNARLRTYARNNKLDVIDFETYAFETFLPRSLYFADSVHPTLDGYSRMGEYIAEQLIAITDVRRKTKTLK